MTRPAFRSAGNVRSLPVPLWTSRLLRACRGEAQERPPVWLMRQAGRYMQHYRGIRSSRSFLELCKEPAAAAEVTLYAREWLGVDAAIIFSDILVVLEALGLPLEFSTGDGPRLPRAIRDATAVDALRDPRAAAADLGYVGDAIRATVAGLPADIPCIGFCGAPFTLAAYAIEGGGSRQFARTRSFMYQQGPAWHRLQARLASTCAAHLGNQIEAGASAVQIFDSWVGCLTRVDFSEFVAPHLTALVETLPAGIPVILFGHGSNHLIDLITDCGADVIGVDQATDLDAAWARCGGPEQIAVQGNLDPALLLADWPRLRAATQEVLDAAAGRPGHIFNLGHGILKETDPERVREMVKYVQDSRREVEE